MITPLGLAGGGNGFGLTSSITFPVNTAADIPTAISGGPGPTQLQAQS